MAEFGRILEERGFWYDYLYHYMITILPSDDKSIDEYFALYRWQWLQHLAQKRLTDIHSEVFDYVEEHPEALARLSWRQYEEVLDSIFKNQGYYTELGPGTNDGGVDIRLYQNSAIPELVTVVQAKRYTSRPIGLDAVAALLGVAVEQRAERGILATTSRFQPKAQRFAKSTQSRIDLPSIELADAKRVSGWCADIAKVLDGYFLGNSTEPPPLVANAPSTELTGKVLVAHGGYEIIANFFGVVEVDFPHEVIVKEIASKRLDPYNSGYEVPAPAIPCAGKRFVAFKHTANDGSVSYWGNGQLYSLWDGTRQWFDHND
ncbi:MAG: restriction endonuclease [Sedimentisphaerales bacterium]|nr:restriction endonuclease [Sedimentisphaerales bacterium]